MDGRSLMPAIEGTDELPETRGIGLERYSCDFRGVRWERQHLRLLLARGHAGCQPDEAEMYDLGADPFQLDDLLPTTEGTPNDELRDQAGPEDAPARRLRRDPRPRPERQPSGHFCE